MNRVFSIYVSTVIKMAVNFGHKFPLCISFRNTSHIGVKIFWRGPYSTI